MARLWYRKWLNLFGLQVGFYYLLLLYGGLVLGNQTNGWISYNKTALGEESMITDLLSIKTGGVGEFDELGAVAQSPPIYLNGTWYSFYSAQAMSGSQTIGLATSKDGISFTRFGDVPVIGMEGGTFYAESTLNPSAIYTEKHWFVVFTGVSNRFTDYQLGVAVGKKPYSLKKYLLYTPLPGTKIIWSAIVHRPREILNTPQLDEGETTLQVFYSERRIIDSIESTKSLIFRPGQFY